MNENEKDRCELILRFCENKATEDECRQVEEWMNLSEENRQTVEQINLINLAIDINQNTERFDSDKALKNALKEINGEKKRLRIMWWRRIERIAAVLLLPTVTVCLLQYFYFTTENEPKMVEIRTNPGMTTSITLPDGTAVCLNSETVLRYPSAFNHKERKVTLNGEGYFAVTKNPDVPFIVDIPHKTEIKVLGTHFNVEAYESDTLITTTLEEGLINFLFAENSINKKIELKPNQKLVYNSSTGKSQLFSTTCKTELSWINGQLIFSGTPFGEVLRMLEKRYNVKFAVRNNSVLKTEFTGTFTNQRLERILEILRISCKVSWRYMKNTDIKKEKTEIEIY